MNEVPKEALIKIERKVLRDLDELKKSKEKNELQQILLEKYEQERHEENEKATKIIVDLKHQVEETTRMKEIVTSQLKDKDEIYQEIEGEIDFLKGELEKIAKTNMEQSLEVTILKGQLEEVKKTTESELLEQNKITQAK